MTRPGDLGVSPARLTGAATSAQAVADTVRGCDVAGPVHGIGHGLPGSGSGAAADELARRWASSVAALADAVTHQASALRASAESYTRSERTTADDLRPHGAPTAPQASLERVPAPGAITRALG